MAIVLPRGGSDKNTVKLKPPPDPSPPAVLSFQGISAHRRGERGADPHSLWRNIQRLDQMELTLPPPSATKNRMKACPGRSSAQPRPPCLISLVSSIGMNRIEYVLVAPLSCEKERITVH